MKNANEVILTGCSAGGLATYVHADYIASIIPQSAKFRAMADAGYIMHIASMLRFYLLCYMYIQLLS